MVALEKTLNSSDLGKFIYFIPCKEQKKLEFLQEIILRKIKE